MAMPGPHAVGGEAPDARSDLQVLLRHLLLLLSLSLAPRQPPLRLMAASSPLLVSTHGTTSAPSVKRARLAGLRTALLGSYVGRMASVRDKSGAAARRCATSVRCTHPLRVAAPPPPPPIEPLQVPSRVF